MMSFLFLILYFPNMKGEAALLPDNSPVIAHDGWNDLLMRYVTPAGKVNYKGMMSEKKQLQTYLDLLSGNPPESTWQRREEMAYWINAYNAFTVKLILDHYPVKSINDIENGKPWDDAFIRIGSKKYSLNMIENEVLRKKFNDSRIHFAINCASKSCPKLLNEAFTPDKLEEQMNSAVKKFVNDPSKNKITADKIAVSKIFDWYRDDFMKNGTVIDFLNQYSDTKIQATATLSFLDYDWSLNE